MLAYRRFAMVNGRPNLIFGDNQYTTPSQVQRGSNAKNRSNRIGRDFESYLPVAEYTAKTKTQAQPAAPAAQSGRRADAGLQQSHANSLLKAGQGVMPAVKAGNARSPLAAYSSEAVNAGLAGIPTQAGQRQRPQQSHGRNRQEMLPTGVNSRKSARAYAQAELDAFNGNQALGSPSVRLSQKNTPRISGRPITGRHNFGMVDTRKQVAGRERPRGMERQRAGQNADNAYASRAKNLTGYDGGQSFVTQGFGGGNAELALRSLGYDIHETQPDTTYARRLDRDSGASVRNGFGRNRAGTFVDTDEAARIAVRAASHKRKPDAHITNSYPGRSLVHSFYTMADQGIGALAAKFESGSDGIAAIGFDRKGGTSYGKFQISSRAGTMRGFIDYLQNKAPDLAQRLRAAGPANTGGRSGRMPTEWRKIAAEDPARFEKLQEDFIRTSHFEPAMRTIAANTGVGFSEMPQALQEVLFSTAVQHGPFGAARIFSQALGSVDAQKLRGVGKNATESFKRTGRQLIKQVYALRAGQFMSSTSGVRAAVRNRLSQEMNEALQMLA